MSRVFIVQSTQKLTPNGRLVDKYDLSPAKKFGELIALLSPRAKPFQPESVIEELYDKLADFSDDDCLLLIGNPSLIGFAVAIAADVNDGRVNVLQWSGTRKDYVSIRADLYGIPPKAPKAITSKNTANTRT